MRDRNYANPFNAVLFVGLALLGLGAIVAASGPDAVVDWVTGSSDDESEAVYAPDGRRLVEVGTPGNDRQVPAAPEPTITVSAEGSSLIDPATGVEPVGIEPTGIDPSPDLPTPGEERVEQPGTVPQLPPGERRNIEPVGEPVIFGDSGPDFIG